MNDSRPVNPYAELRALLDTTRQLAPEEMAELQLEQGHVDQARRIYEELSAKDPSNRTYAMRREWLARMAPAEAHAAVVPLVVVSIAPSAPALVPEHGRARIATPILGTIPISLGGSAPRLARTPPGGVGALTRAPTCSHEPTLRGAPAPRAGEVRSLRIVRVG